MVDLKVFVEAEAMDYRKVYISAVLMAAKSEEFSAAKLVVLMVAGRADSKALKKAVLKEASAVDMMVEFLAGSLAGLLGLLLVVY